MLSAQAYLFPSKLPSWKLPPQVCSVQRQQLLPTVNIGIEFDPEDIQPAVEDDDVQDINPAARDHYVDVGCVPWHL